MPLEPTFNFIDDLNSANPNNSPDQVKEAANHLRGTKQAVQGSFPNLGQTAVTLTAAEINQMIIDVATNASDIGTNTSDIATNASDITANTNLANSKIGAADYATPTVGGTLKARLSGTTLYMSNNGSNP